VHALVQDSELRGMYEVMRAQERPRGCTDSARLRGSLDSAHTRGSTDSSRPASDDNADAGAGTWLASWQALIDVTPTTPTSLHGPVRRGAQKEELAAGEAVLDVEICGLTGKRWPEMKATEGLRGRFEKVIVEMCMRGGEE
jgi:hypothetical protein